MVTVKKKKKLSFSETHPSLFSSNKTVAIRVPTSLHHYHYPLRGSDTSLFPDLFNPLYSLPIPN